MDEGGHVVPIAIVPCQVRAARGLLGWSRDRLVEQSGVTKRTVVRFEQEKSKQHRRVLNAIRDAFEAAGVEFIADNGGGAGVRLRRKEV